METQDDGPMKGSLGASPGSGTPDSGTSAEASLDDVTIVLDNRRLLIACSVLILICGVFFAVGFIAGRTDRRVDRGPTTSAPPAKIMTSPEGFLDPECHTPWNFSGVSDLEKHGDDVQPTAGQMAQIRRLLPRETRIHDMLRVDAVPPLAFVLHQPQPRTSRATELTMFRFKSGGMESEGLGSYCFIPDFLITPDGRAIGAWAENPLGGNAWGCSSLKTMLVAKDDVLFPEIESETWQVAKDLILDEGVPVLLLLDTRFEFFSGLCHACSPIKTAIFELNRRGVWTDATARHRRLIREWIQEDIEVLQEAQAGKDETEIVTAALNLYLDAESAGCVPRYLSMVKRALNEIGWSHFAEMVDEAARRRCPLAKLR
jgi:hypothetical protein